MSVFLSPNIIAQFAQPQFANYEPKSTVELTRSVRCLAPIQRRWICAKNHRPCLPPRFPSLIPSLSLIHSICDVASNGRCCDFPVVLMPYKTLKTVRHGKSATTPRSRPRDTSGRTCSRRTTCRRPCAYEGPFRRRSTDTAAHRLR